MARKSLIYGLVFIVVTLSSTSCEGQTKLNNSAKTINSETSIKKPYVILISLDGFRWDYVERFKPPQLSKFIANGVKAESLIPSFPSKTFPNHYTIATGMYPDNHGLVGNSFYSYDKDKKYSIGNREVVEDGSFYGGSPIWVLADKAEMVSASYFFVGSEANVQGLRPTYYYRYDGSVKNDTRVTQALEWLNLPKKERPHIITMYFSDMDDTGHGYGPNNDKKIKKALYTLDESLGKLFSGSDETELPINIIIVSDHGMAEIKNGKFIPVEEIENKSMYLAIDNGAIVNIHPIDNTPIDSVYQYLKHKEDNFRVYKTENTPGFEYTPENKDWGAIQLIPDPGYYFQTSRGIEARSKYPDATFGVHGYDTRDTNMHGIFYANGPAFKKGYVVPSVKNIHIYPIMCEILGLEIPNNIDGELDELENILK